MDLMIVGERVLNPSIGEMATVQFNGNIKGQDFVGIEYDNPVGKYNGTYEGIQYFRCEEKHGAFLK